MKPETLIKLDGTDISPSYHCIGRGNCGSVWSFIDSRHVIKREDCSEFRSVNKDSEMHLHILKSINTILPAQVRIPSHFRLVEANDSAFWNAKLPRLPKDRQDGRKMEPCRALITQRIPPFSLPVRELLISRFCPSHVQSLIDPFGPDRDCIIRLGLGRRRKPTEHSTFKAFSLRNYKMWVEQMEELGLQVERYAQLLAETLAAMYWVAHVDAADVEFVLAPPAPDTTQATVHCDILGEHVLWTLDFDLCRRMTMDESGVRQATRAFWGNDPYLPRPGCEDARDQELWKVFRQKFLQKSAEVTAVSPNGGLPRLWVEKVEEEGDKIADKRKRREEQAMRTAAEDRMED